MVLNVFYIFLLVNKVSLVQYQYTNPIFCIATFSSLSTSVLHIKWDLSLNRIQDFLNQALVAQWVLERPGAWVGSGDPSHPSNPEHHPPLSHILAPLHSQDSTHCWAPFQLSDSAREQSLSCGLEAL